MALQQTLQEMAAGTTSFGKPISDITNPILEITEEMPNKMPDSKPYMISSITSGPVCKGCAALLLAISKQALEF
jgi:hypothetical protein